MKELRHILLIIFLAGLGFPLQAATVQSVADGYWTDPGTWESGVVPSASDHVIVYHSVSKDLDLEVAFAGTLEVRSSGTVTVQQDLNNAGYVRNEGMLILGGMENLGSIDNYGKLRQTGTMENRNLGTINNYNRIDLQGDLENYGTFNTPGVVYMTGDLENGGTMTPGSGTGYIEVCGSAKNKSRGTVVPTIFLCVKCGGSVEYEPGSIGKWTLECNPFAVELVDFRGEVSGPEVRLSWGTESENQSDYFAIERYSIAGGKDVCTVNECFKIGEFQEIGQVPAAGSSTSSLSYEFRDATPVTGINFYRLRMVDRDGNYAYSPTVDLLFVEGAPSLLVYPNPTNSTLNIRLTGTPGVKNSLKLYDISGRLLYHRTVDLGNGSQLLSFPTCGYSSGTYILEYTHGDQRMTRKVVFQR